MQYDAMIIGGGASGLIAACALARKGRRVVLLEKQDRVGRKLLSTGNGRCNLTNLNAGAGDYHGSRQASQAALRAWPPKKVSISRNTVFFSFVSLRNTYFLLTKNANTAQMIHETVVLIALGIV